MFRVNLTPEIDFLGCFTQYVSFSRLHVQSKSDARNRFFGMFYPICIIFKSIETYNKYFPILQRSIFYVDRIAKCEIGGGPLSQDGPVGLE